MDTRTSKGTKMAKKSIAEKYRRALKVALSPRGTQSSGRSGKPSEKQPAPKRKRSGLTSRSSKTQSAGSERGQGSFGTSSTDLLERFAAALEAPTVHLSLLGQATKAGASSKLSEEQKAALLRSALTALEGICSNLIETSLQTRLDLELSGNSSLDEPTDKARSPTKSPAKSTGTQPRSPLPWNARGT